MLAPPLCHQLPLPSPHPKEHGNLPRRKNKLIIPSEDKLHPLLHFHHLLSNGLSTLNPFTFSSLFKSCAHISTVQEGRQLHVQAIKRGFTRDIFVHRSITRMYSKYFTCHDAMKALHRCSGPDTVSRNDLIIGFSRTGDLGIAREIFDSMPERNVVSWTVLLDGYAKNGQMEKAQELFDLMPERNHFSWTSLVSGYLECGQMKTARKIFGRRVAEWNVVTWTAMISGYVKNGECREALDIFVEMQVAGVKPNVVTLLSALSAVTQLGALGQGRWIHCYADKMRMEVGPVLGSSLVDMYSKCGSIDDAIAIFKMLKQKELPSWNSIISGLAAHGRGRDALRYFSRMQAEISMTPNDVTFVAVLSACSHSGLVDEGWEMFRLFTEYYNLSPKDRHYGCMVDLLGRAGLVKEALEFVEKMPIEPTPVIWKALLSACKVHTNVEMVDRILRRIAKLEPRDSGFYSLITNMFRDIGRWDDAKKVRREMNDLRVSKEAGCSWVEVDGVVCEFLMGRESFHDRSEEIASVLYEIDMLMRLEY